MNKWVELISNTSGKLSGSGLLGLITGILALSCFLWGTYMVYKGNKDGLEVLSSCSYLLTIAGALMGIRKFTALQQFKYEKSAKIDGPVSPSDGSLNS